MWLKQVQLFKMADSVRYLKKDFLDKLEDLAFRPCLPSMSQSLGWFPPVDEEASPIAQILNGNIMLCLQIEEKILPAAVIRQELSKKIKQIETAENRKIYQKEKLSLKDETVMTLLPKAFSKITKLYGYIDTKNNWLIIGTANEKKAELFLKFLKKSVTAAIHPFELQKLSPIMTYWLKKGQYPRDFAIEKSCLFQDPNQKNRFIRCQHQDLFAPAIQSLLADGCEVKQLAISWSDRLQFVLSDNFSLQAIKFEDKVIGAANEMEAETKQQQANADFLIMSDVFAGLFKDLLHCFAKVETMNAA